MTKINRNVCSKICCWQLSWLRRKYGYKHASNTLPDLLSCRSMCTEKENTILLSTPFYHAHLINTTNLLWYKQFPVTGHHEQIIMFSRQIPVKIASQPCQQTLIISQVLSHVRKFTWLFIIPVSPAVVNRITKYENWSMYYIHSSYVASEDLNCRKTTDFILHVTHILWTKSFWLSLQLYF